jgi:hypothetical protein
MSPPNSRPEAGTYSLSLLAAVFFFACCGGSTADQQGSDGGPSGKAGDGGNGDAAECPATIPSGSCGNDSAVCTYVDAQGCPLQLICFSQFPGQAGEWTSTIPEPGGSCATTGQVCGYAEVIGDNLPRYADLECNASGKWEVKNPCPAARPAEGAPCTSPNTRCPYGAGTCTVSCSPEGQWQSQGCGDAGG